MIDMLNALFPTENTRFRFTHQEFKSQEVGLRQFIRDRNLGKAFATRDDIGKSLSRGELWTFERDDIVIASYSFAGLLRGDGVDAPEMFDNTPPALPRHDGGLILSYFPDVALPWRLHWFCESPRDKHACRGRSLEVLLNEAFAFDVRRATTNARDALYPSRPFKATAH